MATSSTLDIRLDWWQVCCRVLQHIDDRPGDELLLLFELDTIRRDVERLKAQVLERAPTSWPLEAA